MNKQEIINAILEGNAVYWMSNGYRVLLQSGNLYSVYIHNNSMCQLQDSEYKDCFIKE